MTSAPYSGIVLFPFLQDNLKNVDSVEPFRIGKDDKGATGVCCELM